MILFIDFIYVECDKQCKQFLPISTYIHLFLKNIGGGGGKPILIALGGGVEAPSCTILNTSAL